MFYAKHDAQHAFSRGQRAVLLGLVLLYLISRLAFLLRLPAFSDEAIYIDWARQTLNGNLAAGLVDGKWLPIKFMAALLLLPLDPLVAARSLSVLAGLATLATCVATGAILFSATEGLIAGLLFVILPYTLFHDRMALVDGVLTAWGAGILLFSVLMTRSTRRLYPSLILLFVLGAVLSKSTGIFFLVIPLGAVLVLAPPDRRAAAFRRIVPACACGGGALLYLLLTGAGSWHLAATVLPGGSSALAAVWRNLGSALRWLWTWLTPPLALLVAPALLLLGNPDRWRQAAFLLLVLAGTVAPYVVVSRVWYPRYLLFAAVPFCLLAGALIAWTMRQAASASWDIAAGRPAMRRGLILAGIAALITWPVLNDIPIVTAPDRAEMPREDKFQYVSGWPSGFGLPELAGYLRAEAAAHPEGINVLRFAYWTPSWVGLDVYLGSSASLQLYTLIPWEPPNPGWASDLARGRRTLVVLNGPQEAGNLRGAGLDMEDFLHKGSKIWEWPRPGASTGLEVWEVLP